MSVITVEEDAFIDIKLEETSVVKFEEEIDACRYKRRFPWRFGFVHY
jgi:hypothetical protein